MDFSGCCCWRSWPSLLAPIAAYAQASVVGVVKDSSGAVLPGVTVEVASPALIEKTRSTVTDGAGLYQIIQLPPGAYTVTFSLSGFSTYKRDGLDLSGNFVATINADMKVGAVAETITVTGETPLVDVQSAAVQKVVTKEVIDAIPTGRLGINLAALQPGIILGAAGGVGVANANALASQDVGGTAGDSFTDLAIHGGKPAEQRQTIGGVSAATTIRFGESLSSSPSFTAMQEMSMNTSGADASMAGGGVQLNYVPRDGGNTFKGLNFLSGASSGMQGTNYSTGTRDASGVCAPANSLFCSGILSQPGALVKVYDFNPGYGGPIKKDKLWFFVTARWTQAINEVPNDYANKNFTPGTTPTNLLNTTTLSYVPNTAGPLDQTWGGGGRFWEQTLRLTYQASPKNKFSAYYNNKKRQYTNGTSATSHEALVDTYFFPFSDNLVQWSSPVSNKFLLEAGFWRHQETWGNKHVGCEHRRSARRRRHGPQPAIAHAGLRPAHSELPRPRRRDRHGQPQPELPRQFQRVVRDGFALVQGGLRPERRLPLERSISRSCRTATSSARWRTTASASASPFRRRSRCARTAAPTRCRASSAAAWSAATRRFSRDVRSTRRARPTA